MALPAHRFPPYLREAFELYKQLEDSYLNNLSDVVKRVISGRQPAHAPDADVKRLHYYGEITFTLAGVKPCTMIGHGLSEDFVIGIVEECIRPLMREFRLDEEGFELFRIGVPLIPAGHYKTPHPGFGKCWVFANTRHGLYDTVSRTFKHSEPSVCDDADIGLALGYPVVSGPYEVVYQDNTECEKLGVCEVPMLDYTCSEGGYTAIFAHIGQYRAVWDYLGRSLTVDVVNHPPLEKAMDHTQRELLSIVRESLDRARARRQKSGSAAAAAVRVAK